MNQFTRFSDVLQTLLSRDEVEQSANKIGYNDTTRRFHVYDLILFSVMLPLVNGVGFATVLYARQLVA